MGLVQLWIKKKKMDRLFITQVEKHRKIGYFNYKPASKKKETMHIS